MGVVAGTLALIVLVAVVDVYTRGGDEPTVLPSLLVRLMWLYPYVALLAAVTFLFWIYQARACQRWFLDRVHASSASGSAADVSPWRAVGVWFIPLANLFLPYEEVEDLFRRESREPDDTDLFLPAWWGCLVGGGVIGILFHVGAGIGRTAHQPPSEGLLWLNALRYALLLTSAVLAIHWIGEFERRAARRTRPLSEGRPATPPATAPPTLPPR
jgi:hypothetical protein